MSRISNLINAEPQPFSGFAVNAPDGLQRIVSKTLRKNKDERYQMMKDLLGDFNGAERACKRAIELTRDSSQAHQSYSRLLTSHGRFDEAIAEIKSAIDIEPASLFNQRNYGDALHYARRYTEAAAQYKRMIAMDKNYATIYQWLSNTLALSGNEAEALEWLMKGLALGKMDEETMQAFQTAFRTSGWQGILRQRAERFEKGNEAYFCQTRPIEIWTKASRPPINAILL